MRQLGVFVGDRGNWTFFREVHRHLGQQYRVETYEQPAVRLPLFRERALRHLAQRRMQRMLQAGDVCFFEWASELLVAACRLPKTCPIVTRMHSYELLFWAPQVDWTKVDRVIFVSDAVRRRFAELYPDHAAKGVVVYNGTDLQRFTPPPDRSFAFRVGMLATIHPVKRIYEAVLAVAELRRRGHAVTLTVGGGKVAGAHFDDYHDAIERLIGRLGLDQHVRLDGHVDAPAEWLRDIDIFLSNSYREGQQVALLEALASGCLCLSHAWSGAEEVLPDTNLFLTDGDLQEKLLWLASLTPDEMREERARMRRIAAEKFDLTRTCTGVADVIAGVLADGGSRA